MQRRRLWTLAAAAATAVLLTLAPLPTTAPAEAYAPTGGVMYELGSQPCLKGRGNCAIYPKSTQLPGGRLVAAFELSTVAPSGTAVGQTMPVYASDDDGGSWRRIADVRAPAYLSTDPQVAKYTSNWTNPYLFVLPQDLGRLRAGTLLLATVVSGEDEYYKERKAADPNWVPDNDGDRRDMAIALYSSTTEGTSWTFENIITTGGWQGGSAGAIGGRISAANVHRQIDPVWEPHLIVHDNRLIAYYSDEQDYTGYDPATGRPALATDNATGRDAAAQILAHRTWDGTGAWSAPVVDAAGDTFDRGDGVRVLGGGRPGMTTVARTTDGRWFMTFEYFGSGDDGRYKLATDPQRFRTVGGEAGTGVTALPVTPGSRPLVPSGSPVITTLPDGRIAFNTNNSGNIWVNTGGRGDGAWTEHQTPVGPGYSRTMQYVRDTGRIVILQGVWGGPAAGSTIRYGEVDLGRSAGPYHQLVNRLTGQVMGTGGNTTDANIGNGDQPDVRLEAAGSATNPDTQLWHVLTEADGTVTLLNRSGGREASIWGGGASAGQRIGQWVDDRAGGTYRMVPTGDGHHRFPAAVNGNLLLTGSAPGAPLTLQASTTNGSQDWRLVEAAVAPTTGTLRNAATGLCLDDYRFGTQPGAEVRLWRCNGQDNQDWSVAPAAAGAVTLVNGFSGLCLDNFRRIAQPPAEARQWTCNGQDNQQWTLAPAGGDQVQVRSRFSGLCLDNVGGNADGAEVRLTTCGSRAEQRWVIG